MLRLPALCRGCFVLLLALLISASVGAGAATAAPLRGTDWNAVLDTDPRIRVHPDAPPLTAGPFITTTAADGTEIAGYAVTRDVLYGDLDLSGTEEAVILVHSGGMAGVIGYLVYREEAERPVLTAVMSGYRLGVEIVQGTLQVTTPRYAGFEPVCCPSAETVSILVLSGTDLVQIDERIRPNPRALEATVLAYYQALNERRFADAYAFLSPTLQARYPYEAWVASNATLLRITVEQVRGQLLPDAVAITLTITERLPNGTPAIRRFGGTWYLVWHPATQRWLLDRAELAGG